MTISNNFQIPQANQILLCHYVTFSENSNFILSKKYAHRETYDQSKPRKTLSPNRNQLLEPFSENIVLGPGNIQNTDALCSPDVHLTNSSADAIILHVGVNYFLEDNSQSMIENLEKNLRSMVEKCHTYGIKNVFISGLVYTTRIGACQFLRGLIKLLSLSVTN